MEPSLGYLFYDCMHQSYLAAATKKLCQGHPLHIAVAGMVRSTIAGSGHA